MQMYIKYNEYDCFLYYISGMYTSSIDKGQNYKDTDYTYQIVFMNNYNPNIGRLLVRYNYSDEYNTSYPVDKVHIIFVYLKEINNVLKVKTIQELSDFERLCYMFVKNDYSAVISDRHLYSATSQRQRDELRESTLLQMAKEDGEAKGVVIGRLQAKYDNAIKLIRNCFKKNVVNG